MIGEAIEACFPGTGINKSYIQRELDHIRRGQFPDMERRYWQTRLGYTAEECLEVIEAWLNFRTKSKLNKKADLIGGAAKLHSAERDLGDALTYRNAMRILGFEEPSWKGGRSYHTRFILGKEGVQLNHHPMQDAYPFLKRSKFVSKDEVRRVYDELERIDREAHAGD